MIQNLPPHSIDAEQGVLCSCLLDANVIGECVRRITEEYFYIPAHRTIYHELVGQWNDNKPTDLIAFTQALRDKNLIEVIGGAGFVTGLYTFVPTPEGVGYYLDILRDKFVLREMIASGTEVVRRSYGDQGEVEEILQEAQSRLLKISEPISSEEKNVSDFASDALTAIMESHDNHGKIPGLTTGLIDLDRKIGGMRPKQFIVIAGDTGDGKTALALKILEHLGIQHEISCAILSLEMGGEELCNRWIASLAKVDMHKFLIYGGNEQDYPKITTATSRIQNSKVIIRDESDITPLQLRAVARQLKHQHQIQLLVVDYIQLMGAADSESREKEVASVAQAMKNCAKELGIVVIGLSQVNDEGRVRDSRAIGFHADKVLFLRHEGDNSWINVRKNRNGPIGAVPVAFLRNFATFENLAREDATK